MQRFCHSFAALVLIAFLGGCSNKPPGFAVMDAADLEVELHNGYNEKSPVAKKNTGDPAKMEAVFAVLRTGRPTSDHKCGSSGQIKIKRKSGSVLNIGILPGHNPDYYEYRVHRDGDSAYGMFKVAREPFVEAMKGLGIEKIDLGQPE